MLQQFFPATCFFLLSNNLLASGIFRWCEDLRYAHSSKQYVAFSRIALL